MILVFVIILLFVLYSILIIYYWQAWRSVPLYSSASIEPPIRVSVIIAARNEELTIGRLLQSLQSQTYPREYTELIVVDDHSTDSTKEAVLQFENVRLLQLEDYIINSYKKKAIETGITAASGQLIVTTDADCVVPPTWLQSIVSFKTTKDAVFVAAPVAFHGSNSALSIFQTLDFMVLQGITAASVHRNLHSMCNGANLAYPREVFKELGGFDGLDHIASGDDMLLMHKIWKRYPRNVFYLKSREAIVTTDPMPDWSSFFHQRVRWASKARFYSDKRILAALVLVYLFNVSFIVLLLTGFWYPELWLWCAGLLLAKTIVEFPFLNSIAGFFRQKHLLKYFIFFQPFHILYTIIAGLLGQVGKYRWKGRRVK
jgi:cellulose synthase/poly-beta-1,6-N-acetylglucosamine synthase-like glycosyltransferase